jgi:hypothetical protein
VAVPVTTSPATLRPRTHRQRQRQLLLTDYGNPELTPRQTPNQQRRSSGPRRADFDPTQLFAQRDRLPWFWFFVAVAVTVRPRLIAITSSINSSNGSASSSLTRRRPTTSVRCCNSQEAKDLACATGGTRDPDVAQRSPKDFDHPELLRQVFLKSALQKAQDQRTREAVEFRAKQLHQKPEIAKIDILATRENEVLATVSGQVIRTGIFQEKGFTEAFNFKLNLRLIRNPNMVANGRFPTAVGDFKYEIIP